MMIKVLPYLISFLGAFVLTLILTPIVRETNRRLGMVDKPDPRRINKVPIPRGGGIAIVLGVAVSYLLFHFFGGHPALQGVTDAMFYKMTALAVGVSLLGLMDDKFGLPPKVKLLGQIVLAALVWFWAGLGFHDLWPWLPAWLDCLITVFWLTGAMNAFNLIDGLDGLASGIALIAVLGMAGSLFIVKTPQMTLFHFAMAGGLLAFLRYNYNPASVFLGDSGSMYIGFVVSSLPLATHAPKSFLVSVGVPLLAMGVPIFDTSLAIIRRSIRHLINKQSAENGSGKVMTADSDHLHHRILRATGLNQRKTAWILYGIACSGVLVGLFGMGLESRAGGLWLLAIAVAAVIIFRDLARIELYDAGRLLSSIVHTSRVANRRRLARLAVPFYVLADLALLTGAFFLIALLSHWGLSRYSLSRVLPVRVISVFVMLFVFGAYRTVWSRAQLSNYGRLMLACALGSVVGSVIIYYMPNFEAEDIGLVTVVYAAFAIVALVFVRTFRSYFRDFFYALDCARLKGRKDVSRILVYGAGLRYRAFRRELVRTTAANDRMIVGLIDDDLLLRNHYIGGMRIWGTLSQAPEVINALNVDTVVIACDVTPEWLRVVRETLAPTGVKVTVFSLGERPLED